MSSVKDAKDDGRGGPSQLAGHGTADPAADSKKTINPAKDKEINVPQELADDVPTAEPGATTRSRKEEENGALAPEQSPASRIPNNKTAETTEDLIIGTSNGAEAEGGNTNLPTVGAVDPEQALVLAYPVNEPVEITSTELAATSTVTEAVEEARELCGIVSFSASMHAGNLELDPNGWFQPQSGDKIRIFFPALSPIKNDGRTAYQAAENAALSRQLRSQNLPLSPPKKPYDGPPIGSHRNVIGNESARVIRLVKDGQVGWDCWEFPEASWKSRFQPMMDETGRGISTRMRAEMFDGMNIQDWENLVTHFARKKLISGLRYVQEGKISEAKTNIGAQAYYALSLRVLEQQRGSRAPHFCYIMGTYSHAAIELSKMKQLWRLYDPGLVAKILLIIGSRHAWGVVPEDACLGEAADGSDIVFEFYRSEHGEPKNAHNRTTADILVEEFSKIRKMIFSINHTRSHSRPYARALGIAEGMLLAGLFNYVTAQQHYGARRNMKIASTVKTIASLGLAGATGATAGAHIPLALGVALGVAAIGSGADHLTDAMVNKIVKIYDWRDGVSKAQTVLNFYRNNIAASSDQPDAIDFANDVQTGQQNAIAAIQTIKVR